MATRADLMVINAQALVGCGYVWGATGQICTQAVLDQLAKDYPDQPNILAVCPKWIGKRVYDCATFVRACLRAAGINICSGATSQWKGDYWEVKNTIDQMPKDRPCVLYYNKTGSTMQHTGIYLGGGDVIDARGSKEGIIQSRIDSRVWTHYAVPRGLYELIEMITAMVVANSGGTVRMRRYASSTSATIRNVPLGETLQITEQGNEWAAVMDAAGHSGFMMRKFLALAGEVGDTATYTVQLLDATATERDVIKAACPRVEVAQNVG